jgi:hypothetical protein
LPPAVLQLGLGVSNNAITRNFAGRVDLSPVSSRPAVGVSAGKRHTCVLFDDGKVWGRPAAGARPARARAEKGCVRRVTDWRRLC